MYRTVPIILLFLAWLAITVPVSGVQLTAQEIFEGMIYYENDQLEGSGVTDYHCKVKQTVEVTGDMTLRIMEKDTFFMVPVYQLDLYGEQAAHIFEPDALLATLEIQDLERLRDEEIDDVDCYVIKLTPRDPVFTRFPATHYIAKDDFRKVKTVNYGSSDALDMVVKTLVYTYEEVEGFNLLKTIVAVTSDEDGNVIHTVTAEYSDYEFNIGLTEQFFQNYATDITVNPTWN